MELSVVTGQVTLEPETSGEVLVEVVNTEDVIDALDVGLGGIPGASIWIDSATPTLFPGERRRLALRVRLPPQVPAGRHRAAVEICGVSTGRRRSVDLDVDVPPRPALAAGAHPAVRRARHRVDFPVTVTNRGNTHLHVRVREFDVPEGVTVEFRPPEFEIAAWSSAICRVRVTNGRHLVGGDTEHVVDVRVTARATTPGRPLLEEEISQETRVTFRQRPIISPGVLLAVVLITVTVLWIGAGFFGLKMFVRLVDPGTAAADAFFPDGKAAVRAPDVGITVAGQVVAVADGSPVAGVTVLACSQDSTGSGPAATASATAVPRTQPTAAPAKPRSCTQNTATASTVSDGNGHFWLPGLFPGPYRVGLSGKGLTAHTMPTRWLDASCSLHEAVSAPPAAVTVAVAYPTGVSPTGPVKVAARLAASPTASEADSTSSPPVSPTSSGTPTASAPAPPCPSPISASKSTTSVGDSSADAAPKTVWRGRATAKESAAGIGTATIVVKGLPAPGRYDLTIDAGSGLSLTVREVHIDAGTKHPVIDVTLEPSASPSPSAS